MKDNKDLKLVVPSIPKTETRIVLEQQDLYPELDYEDIGSKRGYGPAFQSRAGRSIIRASITEQRSRQEREKEEKKQLGLCTWVDCQSPAEIENLCAFHRRERKESKWVIKTVADTTASIFIPGYSVAKAVLNGVDGIKDEAKSEAWDIAATAASGSLKVGGRYSTGVGIASSTVDWINHKSHVNSGENYRSSCPICRS